MSVEPIRPLLPINIHVIEPEVLDAEIVDDDLELPLINIRPEHEAVTRVMALLAAHCKDLFHRGGELVRVVCPTEPHAAPVIETVSQHWLRDQISRLARFQRQGRDGSQPCLVPDWLAIMLLDRRDYPGIRSLRAVAEAPILSTDGQVHRHGYDPDTAVLVLPGAGNLTARMPESPTLKDAQEATAKLLAVVQDFPFAPAPSVESHRAAWMALVLGLPARYVIDGPMPYGVIDASSQSSGKGVLMQVTTLIGTGRHATVTPCSSDKEELRRVVLSVVLPGDRVGWLDEIPSPFGGRAWNALCTAWPTYADRKIRTSSALKLPALTCWVISGNNVLLDADSTRRALIVRLEPDVENPENRGDFRQADLLGWVKAHQPDLIEAALTILVAFHIAGRPRVIKEPIGSYESWDGLVRQAVAWVTGQDPMAPRKEMASLVDCRRTAWAQVAQFLHDIFGGRSFTSRQALVELAGPKSTDAAREALDELLEGKPANPRAWGFVLGRHRGLIARGLRLDIVSPHRNEGLVYRLTDTRKTPEPHGQESTQGEL